MNRSPVADADDEMLKVKAFVDLLLIRGAFLFIMTGLVTTLMGLERPDFSHACYWVSAGMAAAFVVLNVAVRIGKAHGW